MVIPHEAPPALQLLQDLREHGAEEEARVVSRWGGAHVPLLLEQGALQQQDTPAGPALLLGPRGRHTLGLAPHYTSPPDVAANQMMRRRLREYLEAQGYRSLGKHGRNLLILRAPDQQIVYLLGQWHPPKARSVRRVLMRLRTHLLQERATLLVATPKPHTLRRLEARSGGLLKVLGV
jgi:hypothetical protein